jgi:hypothetical protein
VSLGWRTESRYEPRSSGVCGTRAASVVTTPETRCTQRITTLTNTACLPLRSASQDTGIELNPWANRDQGNRRHALDTGLPSGHGSGSGDACNSCPAGEASQGRTHAGPADNRCHRRQEGKAAEGTAQNRAQYACASRAVSLIRPDGKPGLLSLPPSLGGREPGGQRLHVDLGRPRGRPIPNGALQCLA